MPQKFHPGKMILSAFFIAFTILACEKDDDSGTNNQTITETVVASANFNTLEAAVIKANLQATLNGAGPFTVFAPDDAAFTASGITTATLNGMTQQQVADILLYHTLTSEVSSANVPAGPNAKVITASGDSVFLTKNSSGVFINGVKVEEADIDVTNGVIHRIGRVLIPPSGDIVATAQVAGTDVDSLVKAVLRANNAPGGDPNLIGALQSGTLTLFAPNNTAFTQLLTALTLNDINQIPVPLLLSVLRYHLVSGRAFSSDLTNGTLTMGAEGNTTVNLTDGTGGGPTITGSGNAGNKSNIVKANIVTRNGVIHIIDRVLLP